MSHVAKMTKCAGLLLLIWAMGCAIAAAAGAESVQTGEDPESYLKYAVPREATAQEPYRNWYRHMQVDYWDPVTHEVIGSDEFDADGHPIKRALFKQTKLHGIQREWYSNGKRKSESPYQNGVMHGVFKRWTENGVLVARYKMERGTGVEIQYHPNGRLAIEKHYANNVGDGPWVEFYPNGNPWSINTQKEGAFDGKSYAFHNNGALSVIGTFKSRNLVGTVFAYNENGTLADMHRFVKGDMVSDEIYQKRRAVDGELDDLHGSDAARVLKEWTAEIMPEFQKYQRIEPVALPLAD